MAFVPAALSHQYKRFSEIMGSAVLPTFAGAHAERYGWPKVDAF
jgi:hypothetical protein